MIFVAAAAIIRDGSILLCQRSERVPLPLLWEFPGGKIEPDDESTEEGLAREINEELGVDCLIGQQVAETIHRYNHGLFNIKLFLACMSPSVNELYLTTAHSRCVWVPLRDLHDFSNLNEFLPSNREFIGLISGFGQHSLSDISGSRKPLTSI